MKERKSEIEAIWNQWADHICNEEKIEEFEYPSEECQKDRLKEKAENWFCIFVGIVTSITAIYFLFLASPQNRLDNLLNIFFYIPLCLVSISFIIGGILDIRSGTKIPSSISINRDGIFVRYADGRCREFDKNNLYRYSFNVASCGALVVFKGGATVKHLEKLNYFPVLRKQLLEMKNEN